MQCQRRTILYIVFLIQLSILLLYTLFQMSSNSGFPVELQDIEANSTNITNGVARKQTFSTHLASVFVSTYEKIKKGANVVSKIIPKIANVTNRSNFNGLKYHYLVCPDPLGRLGNMMFEFASSIGIANTLGYKHIIKPSHTLLKYFRMKQDLNINLANLLTMNEGQWRDPQWRADKKYLFHNLTLSGYFQSFKYFQNVSKNIREMFTIKGEYLNQAINFLKNNTPQMRTLIGLHVRRGDFLSQVSINEGRVVADRNYTQKSMNFFRGKYKDAVFVILSDDQKWCKENIKGSDVIFSPFTDPIVDMAILSLCNHTIITSGSFGWWGAWLANGTVVYLRDFPKKGSALDKGFIRDEYYFPHWIGMSNG